MKKPRIKKIKNNDDFDLLLNYFHYLSGYVAGLIYSNEAKSIPTSQMIIDKFNETVWPIKLMKEYQDK